MQTLRKIGFHRLWLVALLLAAPSVPAAVVYDKTSPYHHIRVVDEFGSRTLIFDAAQQSRMSLSDPLRGHFEYTEYFHLPWLWNEKLTNVLMIGLGGASTQRAFQRYYPDVLVETVELDPQVVTVAKDHFRFRESPNQRVHVADGRVFLRRSRDQYGLIILDAYTANRYGSYVPHPLATQEFFALAYDHLATNGLLAYNVMGNVLSTRSQLLGALYNTMQTVFPQLYLFPARTSQNVIVLASKARQRLTPKQLQDRVLPLGLSGRELPPWFKIRVNALDTNVPASSASAPVLRDDYAPVDGLLRAGP